MIQKNKKLKYILMFIIMVLILCIGKSVKAAGVVPNIQFTNGNACDLNSYMYLNLQLSDDPNSGLASEPYMIPGNDTWRGTQNPFFCIKEFTPWKFGSWDFSKGAIDNNNLWYECTKKVDLGACISFGLKTGEELGYLDMITIQHLIWGAIKFYGCNGYNEVIKEGNSNWYNTDTSAIVQRANQFGMFYYGILNGGKAALNLTIDESNSKVFINQNGNGSIILGPYTMNVTTYNDEKLGKSNIKTVLRKELLGEYKEEYGDNIPIFATHNLEFENMSGIDKNSIKFLDKDGDETQFPNFGEPFYIKCKKPANANVTALTPKITIDYINKASGKGYMYESNEMSVAGHSGRYL